MQRLGQALVLLLLLLLPAGAAAAPTWLAFETLSGANPGSGAADVAVAADGRAVVVWSSGTKVQANVRPPGGAWTGPVDLESTSGDCCAAVAMDASGKAYAAYEACPSDCFVYVRTLPVDASEWTPAQQVSSPVFPEDIGIAADPSGNALIVWTHYNSGHYLTYARYRAANSVLGNEDLITSGDAACCPRADVSMGGNGLAAVVWEFHPYNASSPTASESYVHGRTRTASGTWTPTLASAPQVLGGPYANNIAFDPHVASDPSGNALATWRASNGTPLGRVVSSTGAWGAVQTISAVTGDTSAPWPAIDAAGTSTAAWCEPAQAPATGWVVRVARAELGASFGSPTTISAPESSKCIPRVAAGPDGPGPGADGGAGVVWRRFDKIIRANVMPPGGAFGAAHDLSTVTDTGGANYNASIAFDASGDALAAWQRAGAVEAAAYDAAPPEARSLSAPGDGTTNSPVSFSVSPFDIWSPFSVGWDFGDGVTSTDASTSHTYKLAGKYDVDLTLTDAVGNAASTKRVIIVTDPPPPGTGTGAVTPVVDKDGDGFPANLDCDDANASIYPGGKEIPGNAVDEDCNGVAEPAPRIGAGVKYSGRVVRGRRTRFDVLRATNLPADATVQLRCRGKGCTFGRKSAKRGKGTSVNLLALLGRRRTVAPRVTLEVWVRAPGRIATVVRFRTDGKKFPFGVPLCVPLGGTAPQKIC